jgi:GAF domain-containing protein
MAILLGLSVLAFVDQGLIGNARVWLIMFTTLSIILFGFRGGLIANAISTIMFVAFGYLIVNQNLTPQTSLGSDFSLSSSSWVSSGMVFFFVNLVISFTSGSLIRGLELGNLTLEESIHETKQLTVQLEAEQERLKTQTDNLERRLVQIRTAAEISRTLGTILDPQELLTQVANLIQTRFDLYYVGVFLLDENNRFAVLSAGTGEAGERMRAENHQLSVGGSSMVGWATSHGEPRVSQNVGEELIRYKNPHLPLTRSEMALPLAIGNQISGAISVQSTEENAFDDDDIVILQSIADSLAIALENARLFEQFEKSLKEIQQLNRQYMTDSWQKIWASEEDRNISVVTGSLPTNLNFTEINVPLTLRGDQVIGNINMATDQAELSPEEREFIEAVSNQAALALESARLLDEANKRVEQERAIRKLTADFSRSLDFESLLQTVVTELGQIPFVKETSIHVNPPEEVNQSDAESSDQA